ncbi:hypothetical protein BAE44_0011229 [Dichanthelium oligosanthes]|uniref:Myb/SANT-like DNA-binding domain-containing protein n=1 Tax=Dichanthelium oligosanthes TaxID=888268 RepID=A0A1E5VRM2_9POAL|nr:hypothetical protein BAE44_0011229 [Dichanthelium oligosanthes]
MERREQERTARGETWRRQEADKFAHEESARAQSITLPPAAAASGDDMSLDAAAGVGKELVPYDGGDPISRDSLHLSTSQWPKHEGRFQEPRLKGPLWEEVSTRMAAAGYGRSAKRCKECARMP